MSERIAAGSSLRDKLTGGQSQPADRQRLAGLNVLFAALGLAVLVPLVWSAVRTVFGGPAQVALGGDYAVLEIYTLHARRFTQVLGPYSRFHWNHPGPFYFYLLLPFYVAFGEMSRGLLVGAFTINLLSLVGAVWIVRHAFSTGRAVLFLALIALTLRFLGFEALSDPWNSLVTVLPSLVFLLLCWLFAIGRPWGLLGMAILGSFLVQTHIGHASLVAAAGTTAFVLGVLELRRQERAGGLRRSILLPVGVSLACSFLLWLPPLWEQVAQPEGNLTRIAQFSGSQARGDHGWERVAAAIDEPLAGVPLGALASVGRERITCAVSRGLDCIDATLPWAVPAHLALLAVGLFLAIRLGRTDTACLGLLTAAGLLGGVLALKGVQAPDTPYLPLWPAALGITTYATAIDALLPRRHLKRLFNASRTKAVASALLVISLLAFSNFRHASAIVPNRSLSEPNWPGFDEGRASAELAAEISAFLDSRAGPHKPVVRLVQHGVWPVVASVVLHEYHQGRSLAVEPNWLFMFGQQFAPSGEETEELLFGWSHFHRCVTGDPDLTFVAESHRLFVYQRVPVLEAHPRCTDLAFVIPDD
ncbi:MAG: hypothetical protein M3252_06590 [Actinomycetota bacterium]|nr:hypothetical protein [Actinomycetota bacterium]